MTEAGPIAVSFDRLLRNTSRTFGLTIPYLPEPTRREVMLAYLLLRAADTLEDATNWTRDQRAVALRALAQRLADGPAAIAELAVDWDQQPPVDDPHCRELLSVTAEVVAAIQALEPTAARIVLRHARRTMDGMARFATAPPPADLVELGDYCYVVAGIVGELLTELFLLRLTPSADVVRTLREHAAAFGEGLQLVNILRDTSTDEREGRRFLPTGSERLVMDRAERDLVRAEEYIAALNKAGAAPGVLMFTALPASLAWATLTRVRQEGPGAKVNRADVLAICLNLEGRYGWASA